MDKIEIVPGIFLTSDHCIWYEPKGAVIIADLHLGYEAYLSDQGITVPSYQKEKILDRISTIIEKYRPKSMVIVGDFKHEFGKNREEEFRDVMDVMEFITKNTNLAVVRGNHDNFLQTITSSIGVPFYQESFEVDDLLMVHGHKEISWGEEEFLVMGHEHPSILIRDEVGAGMKLPCFLYHEEEKILVLPAFSPLAEGRDVSRKDSFFSEALRSREIPIGEFRVFIISGSGVTDFHTLAEIRKAYPDII